MQFSLGQRWISNNETELGLGTLVALDQRTVTLLFPASGEQRLYAINDAPITRLIFSVGDKALHHEGWSLTIEKLDEQQGVITYIGTDEQGEPASFKETFLSHQIVLNRAQDRLLAGQLDRNQHFVLRNQTLNYQMKQKTGALLGLRGARVGLLPHQLNIAHEVGSRFAPRVLLADEVGLGKTIEAGLILHRQLISGLASRVLIVVPESLQHQWLLEMLRRINLRFSLFDKERFDEEALDCDNPFESEQLVICSTEFLLSDPRVEQNVLSAHWDLMVVDEAHHLTWSAENPSREYQLIDQLAQRISGVLLLTATPDQLGHESHFARLRLLDPQRFFDYEQFKKEESGYSAVAAIANTLLGEEPLDEAQQTELKSLLSEQDITASLTAISEESDDADDARAQLISSLLDRHGTGRIFFRNTRSAVKGFPKRLPLPAPLKLDDELIDPEELDGIDLCPEEYFRYAFQDQWLKYDPRIEWLIDQLNTHKGEKFLLITRNQRTVMELEQHLRLAKGFRTSLFHEKMSLIERDRAAAYFADDEQGAQILLCSEIGSEGRNFQFARHLILLDLPLNTDLLEQRIGRLDRIGQQHDVQIHIPYIRKTPQELLYHWYEIALNAFAQPCPSGTMVMERYFDQLESLLEADIPDLRALKKLAEEAATYHQQLQAELEAGRDRLLELNSGGGQKAQRLAAEIKMEDNDPEQIAFALDLFDSIGADTEEMSEQTMLLRPTEKMHFSHLPGVPEEGITFTFDRDTALCREDVQFMGWEHPVLQNSMEQLTSSEFGSAAVAILKNKALPAGTLLLEVIYLAHVNAPRHYQISRFLPATPVRLLLDAKGNDLGSKVSTMQLNQQLSGINRHIGSKLVGASTETIRSQLEKARTLAETQRQLLITEGKAKMEQQLQNELSRMEALKQINPNIREQEIELLREQLEQADKLIGSCELKLDALRFIVVSHQ